jgi:ubiquinone/menaquinone biosynthesis C-methylase UbiE
MKINNKEFKKYLGSTLTPLLIKKIRQKNLSYNYLNKKEYNKYFKKIITSLIEKNIKKSGKEYKKKWEKGWYENYYKFKKTNNFSDLIPKYFFKERVSRIGNNLIKTKSKYFDYKILNLITSYIFEKYLKKEKKIIEFGCGTGHNLLNLNNYNNKAELYGLDWASSSQKILKLISTKYANIQGYKFDYFNPKFNNNLNLAENKWCCYTVASLEQIGNNFKKYMNFLRKYKPGLVINIEPINELMNQDLILDYLSVKYSQKRNYLDGYFSYLKVLEKKKILKFLEIKKSYFGSLYINGYSILVWKFIK